MPWKIVSKHPDCPAAKSWAVVKQGDGKVVGCHRTRKRAVKQLAALNAAEDTPMTKQEFDKLPFGEKIRLYYEHYGKATNEAQWSTAFINDLSDHSFAVIEKGGTKDSGGKTTPRSYRHLPHHGGISKHTSTNTDGSHLKNAAARANQLKATSSKDTTERVKRAGKAHLRSHYRAHGMDIPDNLKETTMEQLVETCSTQVEILEQDTDDNAIARARFRVSEIDQRNRNGRVYPVTVWENNVRRFTKGSVTGQDTHPGGGFFGGVPRVTDAFLIFDKLELVGHSVFGEAIVADTQQARDFVAVAKAGAKIAVSTRGFGKVNEIEKWRDGKPAFVVQDDYVLVGIDVLLDGYQSVPTAKMKSLKANEVLAYFVHEDWRQTQMNLEEITAEWLREQLPDIYEEVRLDLASQIEDLEAQVTALTEENAVADVTLQATQAEVERLTGELAEATTNATALSVQVEELQASATALQEHITGLEEQVTALTGERDAAAELAEARKLIFEKVQGERAAMLIVRDLLPQATTTEAVKKLFPKVKREAEAVLSSLPAGEPRSRYVPTEHDAHNVFAGQTDRIAQALRRQFGGGSNVNKETN